MCRIVAEDAHTAIPAGPPKASRTWPDAATETGGSIDALDGLYQVPAQGRSASYLVDERGNRTPKRDVSGGRSGPFCSSPGRPGPRGITSDSFSLSSSSPLFRFLYPIGVAGERGRRETGRTVALTRYTQAAVDAKLASLDQEFESVRLLSSELPYWQAYLWEREAAKVEDWALLDAWYRSRCLELPQSGHSMVPCLDLANHSREPNAFYDQTGGGDAVLLPRPGGVTDGGGEITISYGGSKSAAEMLFSYGFIDENSINSEMTLPFQASQDDPLAQAKLHVYEGSPTVRLIRTNGIMGWDSPFVHLAVLNEEDGLEFRIQQDMSGDRQLRVFWQEEDVTSQASEFERLTESHPLSSVFRLRAVAMLEEMVTGQLQSIHNSSIAGTDPSGGSPGFRADCAHAAKTLRETETLLLSDTLADFGHQVGYTTRQGFRGKMMGGSDISGRIGAQHTPVLDVVAPGELG